MQKSMLVAAFLLPLLVLIPISAHAQFPVSIAPAGLPVGMTISNDGLRVYVAEPSELTRFTLTTPFDITSIVDAGIMQRFDPPTNNAQGVMVHNNGATVFLVSSGSQSRVITLPADPMTGELTLLIDPPDCCGGGNFDGGISRGGNWIFLGRDNGVVSYRLENPFDITDDVSFHGTFDTGHMGQGVSISNDGTRLFTFFGTTVSQYALSTPFHLNGTSSTPVDTFTSLIPFVNARGMDFSTDGRTMYLLDTSGGDRMLQYALPEPFTLPTAMRITADAGGNLANGASTAEPAITFNVQFSEDVTGFVEEDIVLTGTATDGNLIISEFTANPTDPSKYTFVVGVGSIAGTVTVSIPEGAAIGANSHRSSASVPFTATFTQAVIPPPVVIRSIPDQTINEGQTLNSLQLYILSHTESPIDRGTIPVVTGELGIPLSVINFSRVVDLENLDLQSIQELVASGADPLQFNDTTGIIFVDGFQIVSRTIDADTDEETIHTIPDTFVTTGIQSDPIPITYTFALQDGSMFSGIFDITVNKTGATLISTLPAGYIVDSSDEDTTVMLNDFFTDPEGGDIIYTVTNPDPEIVDLSITGDILSIDPVSSGIVAAELCATSQVTGVPNAITCETITVTVRDIETTESGIFLDSSINVNHDLLAEDVVLNWDDFAIDPRVAFNHIIITADNADATGEIRINQTDPATLVPELTSNGTTVQIRVFPSNGSGSISYNPTSDFTTPTDSVTFTAVLHGPTIIPSTGVVVGDIIPLVHDSLIVNYTIVNRNNDAAPGELHSGLKFGPRNAVNDRFAIPLNDLFVDNDNSRPRLDVTITGQSNQALSASIVGDRLIVTPPGPGCNCQTRFTFALDDGVNLVKNEQLLFRFESDPAGTVPLGFPQSPVGRLFLTPGFEPFLLNLPDLVARGDAAFAEHVTISNVQLPEDGSGARDNSHITATRINATHYQIAPGTNDFIGFEFITFDVRFADDPVDVTVFTSYRLEFDDAPVVQLVLDETPPTVTITSTDVEDRGETTLDVATFRAEFSERIVASTFTEDDITFVGPPGVHMATNVARVNDFVYSFQIDSEDIEANLIIRIDAGAFTDLQGNLNEESTAPYSFTFVSIPTVTITSDDVEHEGTANLETIRFMAEFSEPVTQFLASEIIVDSTASAGTHRASNLLPATGPATIFTFDVQRNDAGGTINVSIPEGAAIDVDRTPHGNAASEVYTATFTEPDGPPRVTITGDVPDLGETLLDVANFNATFSEPIMESTFTLDDITFLGGSSEGYVPENLTRRTDLIYSFQIGIRDTEETLSIFIAAGAFMDLQGTANVAPAIPYLISFGIRPTVNVTSTDVEHEGTTNLETIRFMAEFSEPVSQFFIDEITVDSTAPAGTHRASNFSPATGQAATFAFDVQRNGTDGTINVSIPEGIAMDVDDSPQSNTASEVRTATFTAGLPPVIILPVISHQYVVDGPISLQFGLVSGRPASFTLDGAPASAAITAGGAFTWTPDTVGNVEFNVVATGPSNADVEPVTLRIVDAVRTLTLNNTLVFDQTFERSTAGDVPRNVDFSRNGTLMFIIEFNDRDITTYSTSGTPFVFANTTGNPNSDIVRGPVAVLPGTTEPSDTEFSNDGRTMFVLGTPRSLHEYSMDSPYDVESLSLVNSHRLTGIDGGIVGFTLSSDGTKLFVLGGATSDISVYEFALGVPFSLSDVSSSGAAVVLIDAEPRNLTFPNDLAFRSDGTSMFVIGGFAGRFHEYALGAPFSILSGVTYVDNSVAFHGETGNVNGLRITADNQHMFTLGSSATGAVDNVFGFSLPEIIIPTVTINSATPEDATVDGIAAFNATFSESVSGLEASDIIISSSAGVHVVSNFRTDDNTVFDFDVLRGATDAIITVSIPAGAAQNAINVGNTASNTYSVNLILTTPSIDYAPTTTHSGTYSLPTDLAFSSNGTLLFVVETGTNDRILQYDLGTAFDVSSRSDDFTAEFFVGSADNSPNGVEFSNNGQRMFIIGTQNDRIHEYILDAPYAMPSSPTDPDRSFPATGFLPDSFPEGLDFSSDGRYMYMTGAQNDRIFGYELGSPFLLGSITKPPVFSDLTVGRPTGSEITDDGSILYVLDEQAVNGFRNLFVYSLGTAHDVSDLTLLETRPLAGVQLTEMEFGSDSRILYVTERTGNGILAFATNTALPELGDLNFGFTEDSDVSELAPIPGSDDDPGAVLEYSLSNHPGWLSIDSTTGQLSGIVPQDNSPLFDSMDTPARCFAQGSVEFTVTVSDDGFDSDNTDDVSRDYTVSVFNNARSPNDLPSNVNNLNIELARTATQLDLSLYTSDTDAEDTLTYSFAGLAGNAITPNTLEIDSDTGLATFTTTGNTGTATIDYLVCDGSHLSSLQVTTVSATQPSILFADITQRVLVGHNSFISAQEFLERVTFDNPNGEELFFPEFQLPSPPGFPHHNPGNGARESAQRGFYPVQGTLDGDETLASRNFIGNQTWNFIVELRATSESVTSNPNDQAIDANGVETGDAVVGNVVERATNLYTLTTFAPTVGNFSAIYSPGDTVDISFPITPGNVNYDLVLDAEAEEMLATLGLSHGNIMNRNPSDLRLSGTIPLDLVPSTNATVDYMIEYMVHLRPGVSTITFPGTLNIRVSDVITLDVAALETFSIPASSLGAPDNATFTGATYAPELTGAGDDGEGNDLFELMVVDVEGVQTVSLASTADEDYVCSDLADQRLTITTTTTGEDGSTAVTVTTIVFEPCSGGSDDSRWKSKATFGTSYTTGLKSVDCGYSMDNTCRDVTDYHVDYLRESIETDSLHDFTLKTSAPNGLRSLGIAFGVPSIGSSLNAAEAQVDVTLERDYTLNSTYKITDVSYTNENSVIGEDAGFSIHKSKCLPSDAESECVTLNIEGVQFREQMYHAPFVIHAMDARGYVTIHYMNDGLLISGDSLNEAPTHDLTAKLAHQRDLAQLSLTRTDKLSDIWTDQFGYTWTKNSYGTWSYVEGPKIVVSPICDDPDKRVCNAFAQKLAAYNVQMEELRDSLYGKAYTMPAFDDLHETLTIQDIDGDSRERFLADNDLLWLLE